MQFIELINSSHAIGIIALMLILGFLIKVSITFIEYLRSKSMEDRLNRMEMKIHDLHAWHDEEDPATGLKKWYAHPAQAQYVKEMVGSIQKLSFSQERLGLTLETLVKSIEKLVDKVDRMETRR